jgi:hypothetical protein
VVFEDELEEVVEHGLEIESVAAGARRFCCVPDRSILRFFFMAAPKFFTEIFSDRVTKIASGPVDENK